MAITVNTATSFPTGGAGYTFNATVTEFVSGVCRLKASAGAASDTVLTPSVSRSGWGEVWKVDITATEAAGYFHRFLVSFDGTTWERFANGYWQTAALADIATRGMGIETIQAVRDWKASANIKFAVYMVRQSGGGNGSIDLISISYGTTETTLDIYAPTDNLPLVGTTNTAAMRAPDFPVKVEFLSGAEFVSFDSGASQAKNTQTDMRRKVSGSWAARSVTERDSILDFLRARYGDGTAFRWQAPGDLLERVWCLNGSPQCVQIGPSVWSLTAPIVEATWFYPPLLTDLFAWWDLSNVPSLQLLDGDVRRIEDLSGNGLPLFRVDDAWNPPIAYDEQNGRAVGRWTQDSNVLGATGTTGDYLFANAPWTVFVALKPGAEGYVWNNGTSATPGTARMRFLGDGTLSVSDIRTGADNNATGTTDVTDTWVIGAGRVTASAIQLYVDGVLEATAVLGGTVAAGSGDFRLGARSVQSADGIGADIGEVIIYNRALTDAEMNLVGNYIAGRWGLTWTDL